MKQGNQFYLDIQVEDENNNLLNINCVEKVQFVIDDLVKTYDGSNLEVSYDNENECFKIWLTEEETFNFKEVIDIDVRILYKEGTDGKKTINGSRINGVYFYDSLKKIELDNGEPAPTPGIDLSEYFASEVVSEMIEIPDSVAYVINIKDIFKQIPDIHITGNGKTASGLFSEFNNLKKIGKITNDEITDTSRMFYWCRSLTSIDLSNFNTTSVTDMASMFAHCTSLTSLNLSNFDTSNVTSMDAMFQNCSALTSLDLSNLNTPNVTDMRMIFYNCSSLTNLDISSFDFTNVTGYSDMFYNVPDNCYILVKDTTAKEWITSKFTNLTSVHYIGE